jgi:hypothetical protein
MKRPLPHVLGALATASVLTGACGASPGAASGPGGIPGPSVPVELGRAYRAAEGIYRAALDGDPEIMTHVGTLREAWAEFSDADASRGASPGRIRAIEEAITALFWAVPERDVDRVGVARAANAVRGRLVNLAAEFGIAGPAEALALDFLGRELLLDGMADDCVAAARHTEAMLGTWRALRPRVDARAGDPRVQGLDDTVAAARAAAASCDMPGLIDAAGRSLRLVDGLTIGG